MYLLVRRSGVDRGRRRARDLLLLFAEELADGHERVKRLALGDHRGAPVVANRAAVSFGLGGRVAEAARTDVGAMGLAAVCVLPLGRNQNGLYTAAPRAV